MSRKATIEQGASLRVAEREARRLGVEVGPVRGTGEILFRAPNGSRVRVNGRRKDASLVLVRWLQQLAQPIGGGDLKVDGLGRNCTLVAARELLGAEREADILAAWLAFGWKPGSGAYEHHYVPALRRLGLDLQPVEIEGASWKWVGEVVELECGEIRDRRLVYRGPTLAKFCARHLQGAYLVRVNGHALVVRDGQVVDPNYRSRGPALRRRVRSAYLVRNAAPSAALAAAAAPVVRRELPRGGDPMVRFVLPSRRRRGAQARQREDMARRIVLGRGGAVPLSVLEHEAGYTRADARWDVLQGVLQVLST